MYIKIYCGDSQKYLLLQSDNVTLNPQPNHIKAELYPYLCAYIDEMSLPIGEQNTVVLNKMSDEFKELYDKIYDPIPDAIVSIDSAICDMVQNTPYDIMVPVLSDFEESCKILILTGANKDDRQLSENYVQIHTVQIDEKTYITTGPIYVMNDDGKTIDRIA